MTWGNYKEKVIERISHLYDSGEAKAIAQILLKSRYSAEGNKEPFNKNTEMNQLQLEQGNLDIERLQSGMPIQYVLEEAWFLNHPYKVNHSVLIPRPETEELVLWATSVLKSQNFINRQPAILDVGCGSGCISISLSQMIPNSDITGIDISKEALETAKENSIRLNGNINLKKIDFLDENTWNLLGTFDLIISNPPYIPENEAQNMSDHVVGWEPHTALFTPQDDPLIFYKKLIEFSSAHLHENGFLIVECHQNYAQEVFNWFTEKGWIAELKKDIFDNYRMISAKK